MYISTVAGLDLGLDLLVTGLENLDLDLHMGELPSELGLDLHCRSGRVESYQPNSQDQVL